MRPSGASSSSENSGKQSPPIRCSTGSLQLTSSRPRGDHCAQRFQPDECRLGAVWRRAGFLHAAPAGAMAQPRPAAPRRTSYYETEAPQGDFGAACRFRPDQFGSSALHRRRRQRALGQFGLLRHHTTPDRPRARHGERRAAARLSRQSRSRASTIGTAASSPTRRWNGSSTACRGRTRLPSRSISGAHAAISAQHGRSRDAAEGDPVIRAEPAPARPASSACKGLRCALASFCATCPRTCTRQRGNRRCCSR